MNFLIGSICVQVKRALTYFDVCTYFRWLILSPYSQIFFLSESMVIYGVIVCFLWLNLFVQLVCWDPLIKSIKIKHRYWMQIELAINILHSWQFPRVEQELFPIKDSMTSSLYVFSTFGDILEYCAAWFCVRLSSSKFFFAIEVFVNFNNIVSSLATGFETHWTV